MGESTPFGTVYFTTNSRMVWHVERDHEYSDDSFTVKLTNTKFNDGPIHKAIGLKLTFGNSPGNESLRFETCDLTTTEFASKLPLRDRLKESLRHGAMDAVELAEALGESAHSVRTILNREKADFIKVDRAWGLKANGVNNVIL